MKDFSFLKRSSIFLFLFIILTHFSFAEVRKLALIKDRDGFTNVRKNKNKDSEVVGKLYKNEFFYCIPSNSEQWWLVHRKGVTYKNGSKTESLNGYMHKSRIKIFENCPTNKKQKILTKILTSFNKKCQDCIDNPKDEKMSIMYNKFYELRYLYILPHIKEVICKINDKDLLNVFLNTLILFKNKTDVKSLGVFLDIYLHNKEMVKEVILKQGPSEKPYLISNLQGGLLQSDQTLKLDKEIIEVKRKEIENFINN